MWVFTVKDFIVDSGQLNKCPEASFVARGFLQDQVMEYTNKIVSAAIFTQNRILLALVALNDQEPNQNNVDTAFLNSDFRDEVHIGVLEGLGFRNKTKWFVC